MGQQNRAGEHIESEWAAGRIGAAARSTSYQSPTPGHPSRPPRNRLLAPGRADPASPIHWSIESGLSSSLSLHIDISRIKIVIINSRVPSDLPRTACPEQGRMMSLRTYPGDRYINITPFGDCPFKSLFVPKKNFISIIHFCFVIFENITEDHECCPQVPTSTFGETPRSNADAHFFFSTFYTRQLSPLLSSFFSALRNQLMPSPRPAKQAGTSPPLAIPKLLGFSEP